MKQRLSIIFGTRPEAIKLAPLVLGCRAHRGLETRVCVSAQHREMLDQVLTTFEIAPDEDLALMTPDQPLPALTARALERIDHHLAAFRPDLVFVQGDTTTTFCAALAAFYRGVPVGHVEAGLRTGDLQAPWPEEANRVMTSQLASLHFAPTEGNRTNLLREGVPGARIFVTGNTVIDALMLAVARVRQTRPEIPRLPAGLLAAGGGARLVLITGHRRESYGRAFEQICRAIATLAGRFADVHFVYPVHLNPNVRGPVERLLASRRLPNLHLIEPLAYLPFVALLDRATVVLTDSGGIQEEAPSLGKPVLVMRQVTERPEGVTAGTVRLVGTDPEAIVAETARLLEDEEARAAMARVVNPYGDGRAAGRILEATLAFLS
jgi:UDP-N-acetylglucosamine 2-epimerase (non-hydrolysing)